MNWKQNCVPLRDPTHFPQLRTVLNKFIGSLMALVGRRKDKVDRQLQFSLCMNSE